MKKNQKTAELFLVIGKVHTIIANRLDRGLGGLSFNEFQILHYLAAAPEGQERRIDLANQIGLTASGVTRLLLPMEKIHLVKSAATADDARTRAVSITAAGREKLQDAAERIDWLYETIVADTNKKKIQETLNLLLEFAGRAAIA